MKEGTDRIPVAEAARLIGCTPQIVRFNMRKGIWKIGLVVPPTKGKKITQYYVYRARVMNLIGGEGA